MHHPQQCAQFAVTFSSLSPVPSLFPVLRDCLNRVCHGNIGLAPRPAHSAGQIMKKSPDKGN
jgi:hypothetical protein